MRVCVPLSSNSGTIISIRDDANRALPVASHFGLAECFALIDSESGHVLGECGISGHCPGACHCPLPDLVGGQVDVLAGQAMGFRLMQLSRRARLPVVALRAQTLGELCDEIRNEALVKSLGRTPVSAVCLTKGRQANVRVHG